MDNLIGNLQERCTRQTWRTAIMAPGRDDLNYDALWALTELIAGRLLRWGIVPGDAVAIAMSDGPEMLVATLAVMRVAACAPLNPGFREAEFSFALSDLDARALIVRTGDTSPARAAARKLGVPVIEALPDLRGPAGDLRLVALPDEPRRRGAGFTPETTLLLHTSATTGRPKLVPLNHAQLIAMVDTVRKAFPQADAGRVLSITPQFHLHCLLSIFVQLASNGSIVCTDGFDAARFIQWMRDFRPTQYTANPTLHRAILSLCQSQSSLNLFNAMRFLTSSGAPLPDELHHRLECTLGVPVIEGYGLTETGRVTMTAFDPNQRKAGSVGRSVGPEVAIMGEDGSLLGDDQEGEIVLRGPTVITGYARDGDANRQSFIRGWFRTGDLGRLDADGFLFVTGRIKEVINRGGEKIRPYEIETVLARHPAVAETAVFGFPHSRLGEDIAAAVVLRSHTVATALDLRWHAAEYLADFKIPRRFVFVDYIPKGQTGKYQRTSLVDLLHVTDSNGAGQVDTEGAPRTELEQLLEEIWADLLDVKCVDRGSDFFAMGGDSLLAAVMLARVEEKCGRRVAVGALAETATIESLAARIVRDEREGDQDVVDERTPCLVTFQSSGCMAPVFWLHALEGGVLFYRHLVSCLGREIPFYAFQAVGIDGAEEPLASIELMIERYIVELRRVQPHGPYRLGGFSMGGAIAAEVAHQLERMGETVSDLILIDSDPLGWLRSRLSFDRLCLAVGQLARRARLVARRPFREGAYYLWRRAMYLRRRLSGYDLPPQYNVLRRAIQSAAERSVQTPVAARVLLLRCIDQNPFRRKLLLDRWWSLTTGELIVRDVPGNHGDVMTEPHVRAVATRILEHLLSDHNFRSTHLSEGKQHASASGGDFK